MCHVKKRRFFPEVGLEGRKSVRGHESLSIKLKHRSQTPTINRVILDKVVTFLTFKTSLQKPSFFDVYWVTGGRHHANVFNTILVFFLTIRWDFYLLNIDIGCRIHLQYIINHNLYNTVKSLLYTIRNTDFSCGRIMMCKIVTVARFRP